MASRTFTAFARVILAVAVTVDVSRALYDCISDHDCSEPDFCCYVPSQGDVCVPSCQDACASDDDCTSEDQRCDFNNYHCTTSCDWDSDCRLGYECVSYSCVHKWEPEEDDGSGRMVVIVMVITVSTMAFFCLCFMVKRRQQNAEAPVNYVQAVNNAGNSARFTGRSAAINQPEAERLTASQPDDTPDAIQHSGPPPYHSLNLNSSREPALPPPPTYDEACGAVATTNV